MAMIRKQKDGWDPNHYLKEQEGHGQEVPGTLKGQVTAQNLAETNQTAEPRSRRQGAAGGLEQLQGADEFRIPRLDFSYKLNLTTEV